jgi:hypothetical protein
MRLIRAWCATAVMLAALLPHGTSMRAASTLFGANLVVNGNAEAGVGQSSNANPPSISGWTTTGHLAVVLYGAPGGFPAATDPGPADRGKNFFSGGSDDPVSIATQTIDLTNGASTIDAGSVTYSLSGYLGGFANQIDNAKLTATFKGTGGTSVGAATVGPVTAANRNNNTALLLRSASGTLPVGTRTIDVVLTMTRDSGRSNDGYADDISLVLTAPAPQPTATVTKPTPTTAQPTATSTPIEVSTPCKLTTEAPAAGAVVSGRALPFTWKACAGAAFYYLQVWLVRPAADQHIGAHSILNFGTQIAGSQYSLKTTFTPKGTYLWRLAAASSSGKLLADWTKPQRFTLE